MVGIRIFGADLEHNLGVHDFFAALWRDVVVVNVKEGVSAFDAHVGAVVVGDDALIEAVKFVGVLPATDLLILGVLEELPVF